MRPVKIDAGDGGVCAGEERGADCIELVNKSTAHAGWGLGGARYPHVLPVYEDSCAPSVSRCGTLATISSQARSTIPSLILLNGDFV